MNMQLQNKGILFRFFMNAYFNILLPKKAKDCISNNDENLFQNNKYYPLFSKVLHFQTILYCVKEFVIISI